MDIRENLARLRNAGNRSRPCVAAVCREPNEGIALLALMSINSGYTDWQF